MDEIERAKLLVENIARHNFGADWVWVVSRIHTSTLHADENRIVVVDVTTYENLEILADSATEIFHFTVEKKLIESASVVVGKPNERWAVTRTWWFTLTDTDKYATINDYPGSTPGGVPMRFQHTQTRKA